jgi:hypothetical protein
MSSKARETVNRDVSFADLPKPAAMELLAALETGDFRYEAFKERYAEQYPSATFSEEQWQEIKESLAERDVDLNVEMVDELYSPRDWWGWEDYTPAQRPLRNVLQEVAYHAAMARGMKRFTPLQQAEHLQKMLTAFERAVTMLASTARDGGLGGGFLGLPTFDQLDVLIKRRNALLAAMRQYIAELQERIAKLRAMGSYKKLNARSGKAHIQYWEILAPLWLKVTGSVGPKRRRHLCRFLLACTLPTLFPDMTLRDLEQSSKTFVSSFFRSR